jgi:hypothetical protein
MTIIDVAGLKAAKSVPVGRLPWGVAVILWAMQSANKIPWLKRNRQGQGRPCSPLITTGPNVHRETLAIVLLTLTLHFGPFRHAVRPCGTRSSKPLAKLRICRREKLADAL